MKQEAGNRRNPRKYRQLHQERSNYGSAIFAQGALPEPIQVKMFCRTRTQFVTLWLTRLLL
jgi:hypothetical protein